LEEQNCRREAERQREIEEERHLQHLIQQRERERQRELEWHQEQQRQRMEDGIMEDGIMRHKSVYWRDSIENCRYFSKKFTNPKTEKSNKTFLIK